MAVRVAVRVAVCVLTIPALVHNSVMLLCTTHTTVFSMEVMGWGSSIAILTRLETTHPPSPLFS